MERRQGQSPAHRPIHTFRPLQSSDGLDCLCVVQRSANAVLVVCSRLENEDHDPAVDARRLSANIRAHGAAEGARQDGPFQGPFRGTYLWRPLPRGDERRPPSLHPLGWDRGDVRTAEAGDEGAGKEVAHQATGEVCEDYEQHSWFLQLTAALGFEDIVSAVKKPETTETMSLSQDVDAKTSVCGKGRNAKTSAHNEAQVEKAGARQAKIQRSFGASAQDLQKSKEEGETARLPITSSPIDEESNPAERAPGPSALPESLTNSLRSTASLGSSEMSCFEADVSILSHASTVARDQADAEDGGFLYSEESAKGGEDEKEEHRRETDALREKIESLETELRRSREASREREREEERERSLHQATIAALEARCTRAEQERGRLSRSRWEAEDDDLETATAWLPPGEAGLQVCTEDSYVRGRAPARGQKAQKWEGDWERFGEDGENFQWRVERAGAQERQGRYGGAHRGTCAVGVRKQAASFERFRRLPPPASEEAYAVLMPFY